MRVIGRTAWAAAAGLVLAAFAVHAQDKPPAGDKPSPDLGALLLAYKPPPPPPPPPTPLCDAVRPLLPQMPTRFAKLAAAADSPDWPGAKVAAARILDAHHCVVEANGELTCEWTGVADPEAMYVSFFHQVHACWPDRDYAADEKGQVSEIPGGQIYLHRELNTKTVTLSLIPAGRGR